MLVDVHCHVHPPDFSLEEIGEITKQVELIAVSCHLHEAETLLEISSGNTRYHVCLGAHPENLPYQELLDERQLDLFLNRISQVIERYKDRILGIGEVGLDYRPSILGEQADWRKHVQLRVFRHQIQLASKYQLPLNIHSRSAGHHAIHEVTSNRQPQDRFLVLMHAFDGQSKYVRSAIESTDYIFFSVPANVVRADAMKKWIKFIPLDRIVLESDAPALAADVTCKKNDPRSALETTIRYILATRSSDVRNEDDLRQLLRETSLRIFPRIASERLAETQSPFIESAPF